MKKISTFFVLSIMIGSFLTTTCYAQENNKTERRKVAIGANFGNDLLLSVINANEENENNEYLTPFKLQLSFVKEKFRFESSIGFAMGKSVISVFGEPFKITSSILNIGVGAMHQIPRNKSDFYLGLRADFINLNSKSDMVFSNSIYGFNIAPVLGVEYHFNPYLSLGVEAALNYTVMFEDTNSRAIISNIENKLLLRFYI
ncbi:MAG: hypothetical protein ACPG5B_13830 [Chitinophagales bacterium]